MTIGDWILLVSMLIGFASLVCVIFVIIVKRLDKKHQKQYDQQQKLNELDKEFALAQQEMKQITEKLDDNSDVVDTIFNKIEALRSTVEYMRTDIATMMAVKQT